MKGSTIIVKHFALCILLLLMAFLNISCSEKPTNADEITENVLQAVMHGDHNKYISYFSGDIRWGIGSEQDFDAEVARIKEQLGEYEMNTLTYQKTERENSLISVFYTAKFTKDQEVTVKSAFREVIGRIQLVGFWLNP